MRILLGVTGGVAAFKSASIIRILTEGGHQVRVVATENALQFIGPTTLANLSNNKVHVDLYADAQEGAHIELADWAERILIAPATASIIGRLANGIATDLLTNVVMASNAQVIIAPAMHSNMYLNAATQENLEKLRSRGVRIIEPAVGRLSGKDSGIGRLPEPEEIATELFSSDSLKGLKACVTLGGTRESIDSVRFLGNKSSGKQGTAFVRALLDKGAEVKVIAANVEFNMAGVDLIEVENYSELKQALENTTCDFLVMAAAVSDFSLGSRDQKISREESLTLTLTPTEDLVASYKRSNPQTKVLAFSVSDDEDWLSSARQKRISKNVEFLFANRTSAFGSDANKGILIAEVETSLKGTKESIATEVIELIEPQLLK